jgi:uncharacterized sporulation protein YeaH/YhbH (DUF444 family)
VSFLVDRRLNSRNRNAVNRQRFLQRYRKQVRKAVEDAIDRRSITDMERGERVSLPTDDIDEPQFGHGAGGQRTAVHPGNKEFSAGDRLPRPKGGEGGGGRKASDSGEGDDAFGFELSRDELLDIVFDGLALPNLVKRQLRGDANCKPAHAGYTSDGAPTRIDVLRTVRSAQARRVALGAASRRRLLELEQLPVEPAVEEDDDDAAVDGSDPSSAGGAAREHEMAVLRRRVARIPFLDDVDVRYHLRLPQPQPVSQAVMFCLMDVSGSMDQKAKDLSKRFFLLLYLFLQRAYRHTEVVFIRHHTEAKEVDEEQFFHARESGGTIVSSALKLADEIVTKRYPADQWNIYGAQASDGDNWPEDSPVCAKLLREALLPRMQYYAYVEIGAQAPQSLWHEYEALADSRGAAAGNARAADFALTRITDAAEIFPVFRGLFEQRA